MIRDKGSKAMGLLVLLVLSTLLSLIDRGRAGITSSFIRSEFPSVDIPLDHEVFAVPKGYNAPQQVHLTQGDYDGTAVIVSWVTADEPGSSQVKYGLSEGNYEFSAEGTVKNYTLYQYKSGYIHQSLLSGLEYDRKYYYEIGVGDSARRFWFQTPPKIDPDAPYTFGVIGDLGQTYNSLSTIEHYMKSGAQSVLFVGDLSYADRYQYNDVGIRWDSWGRFVEQSAAYQPWMWCAGNHEIDFFPYMEEVTPFKSYLFRYPTPYQASQSTNPLWYAIRRASAHIIVLSSYSPFVKYTPQWRWLGEELKRLDRKKTPWLIVLMHVPIYNSNDAHFMEGESTRAVFESWFVEYKVDVVFAGHVHAYERSGVVQNLYRELPRHQLPVILDDGFLPDQTCLSPICPCIAASKFSSVSYLKYTLQCHKWYPYPIPDESAPVYITVGDGGNQEGLASRFRDPQPEYSAFREASYGHSTLEIKNRTHVVYHWNRNDDGKRIPTDSFILLNQHWGNSRRRRNLRKHHLHSVIRSRPLSAQL